MTAAEFLDTEEETQSAADFLDAPDVIDGTGFEKKLQGEGLRAPEEPARGPTVAAAAAADYLDAPVENVSEFLKNAGPDADPKALVSALEEYDADPGRVLSPAEYQAKEAALSRLPVGERVRRKWEGAKAALGAIMDTAVAFGKEAPTMPELLADVALRVAGTKGAALERAAETLPKLPGTAVNVLQGAALTAMDYGAELNDINLITDGTLPTKADVAGLDYERYVFRKGLAQQRAEILSRTDLPGIQGVGDMLADPMNAIPLGVGFRGASVTGQVVKRGTAMAGSVVEAPAGWLANTIARTEEAVAAKAAAMGVTPELSQGIKWGAGVAGTGLTGLGLSGDDNNGGALVAGALLGLPAAASLTKHAARMVQASGAAVRRGAQESLSATGLGVKEFAAELARDEVIPQAYRSQMLAGRPVDSPLRRAAQDAGLPDMTRRLARTVDNMKLAQALESVGGVVGSSMDAAILNAAMASGRSDQEIGGAIATGALFGGMGRVVHRLAGAERRMMENGDVARMLSEVAADCGDYQSMLNLPHDQLAAIASAQGVFGRNVTLKPLRAAEFQSAMQERGLQDTGRGVHIQEPGGSRDGVIFVNVDKLQGQGPHVFLHEYAHALQKSNVLNGAMREEIRSWIDDAFPVADRQAARVAYASKVEGSNDPARVAQRLAMLDRADAESGRQPGDWLRDELWAETFAGSKRGLDFWAARGRGPGVLRAVSRSLAATGIPIDPSTGRVVVESPVFGKVQAQIKGSVLERRLNDYVREYGRWIEGSGDSSANVNTGARVFAEGVPKANRFVRLSEVAPRVRENQFMREVDGRLAFKTQAEVDAEFESRKKTFENIRKLSVPAKSHADWGIHVSPDGKRLVGGRQLPERFIQQPNIGPYLKAVEGELRAAEDGGTSVRLVYHKIGSSTAKGYRVNNLGNLRAEVMEVVPFWRSISQADNVLVHVLDVDQFRRNAIKKINKGELPEFNNDMAQLERDLKRYMDNHAQGLPGETVIGSRKRDGINGLLGIGTIRNKGANPLAHAGQESKSAVKTLRLDRVEVAREGNQGLSFDYHKADSNLMPDGEWRADGASYMPDDVAADKSSKPGVVKSWDDVRDGHEWNSVKKFLPREAADAPVFRARGSKDEVVRQAAEFLRKNPVVQDRKGRIVFLPNGQTRGGYSDPVMNRAEHVIGTDSKPGAHDRNPQSDKIQWLAAVPDTISHAPVRVHEGSEVIYFRNYRNKTHQVVTTKEGVFVDQQAYDSGLVTQYPLELSKKQFKGASKVELLPPPSAALE